jgi:hypothetical protein
MPGLPTRLAQRTSRRLDLEPGQLSKSRTVARLSSCLCPGWQASGFLTGEEVSAYVLHHPLDAGLVPRYQLRLMR